MLVLTFLLLAAITAAASSLVLESLEVPLLVASIVLMVLSALSSYRGRGLGSVKSGRWTGRHAGGHRGQVDATRRRSGG